MKPRIIRRNQNLSGPVILGLRIKGHKEALEIARNGRLWPIFPNGFQKNARWPSTHALTRSFSGQDEACKPSNLSASVWILSSSVDIQLVRCSTFCSHFYISLCSWMFLQSCSVNKISVVYSRTQGLTLFCLKNDNIFTLYLVYLCLLVFLPYIRLERGFCHTNLYISSLHLNTNIFLLLSLSKQAHHFSLNAFEGNY